MCGEAGTKPAARRPSRTLRGSASVSVQPRGWGVARAVCRDGRDVGPELSCRGRVERVERRRAAGVIFNLGRIVVWRFDVVPPAGPIATRPLTYFANRPVQDHEFISYVRRDVDARLPGLRVEDGLCDLWGDRRKAAPRTAGRSRCRSLGPRSSSRCPRSCGRGVTTWPVGVSSQAAARPAATTSAPRPTAARSAGRRPPAPRRRRRPHRGAREGSQAARVGPYTHECGDDELSRTWRPSRRCCCWRPRPRCGFEAIASATSSNCGVNPATAFGTSAESSVPPLATDGSRCIGTADAGRHRPNPRCWPRRSGVAFRRAESQLALGHAASRGLDQLGLERLVVGTPRVRHGAVGMEAHGELPIGETIRRGAPLVPGRAVRPVPRVAHVRDRPPTAPRAAATSAPPAATTSAPRPTAARSAARRRASTEKGTFLFNK